ncbi:hypothetical protein WBP07_05980 [Novosphingobium sp. BL-8A]|uniref:hypothetical protein n=1 Tax=Novosphingobium sp. BL-8A TaxID=3127639 RepID=UPI003757ECA0
MRKFMIPIVAATALGMAGCASNYGGEGALAGGALGAGVGAIAGNAAAGAAVGAAAGAAVGSTQKKHDGCYRYDRNGNRYWDRDC